MTFQHSVNIPSSASESVLLNTIHSTEIDRGYRRRALAANTLTAQTRP